MKVVKTDKQQEILISKLKQGDKEAFNLLYENYSAALYGVIFRMLQREDAAGDTLQEVFVKIWKKIDTYNNSKGSLYTWMLNIARNTSIDKLRKIKREGQLEIQSFEEFVSNSNVLKTSQNTDHIGLKEVIDELEPDLKLVIQYLYFGGYTQQELSDELEIPLGTVKSRSRKALRLLRSKIGNFIFWI